MGFLTNVFIDRHSELRPGWRMVLFFLLFGTIAGAFVVPLAGFLAGRDALLEGFVGISILLASYCMTRFVNRKPFAAIGISVHPAMLREFGLGLLLGFCMMSLIFVAEISLGCVTISWRGLSAWGIATTLVNGFAVFATAAATEELLFRGYLFQTLIQAITFLPAMLLMAVIFALAHLANQGVTTFGAINVALAGVWLSFAYMKTRSLWLPFGLHFSWNFAQTTLYAFRTSGQELDRARLFDSVQSGPAWLTGGSFGPEGGVLATVTLLACTWYILKSKRLLTPDGIITLDSIEDLLPRGNGSARGTA